MLQNITTTIKIEGYVFTVIFDICLELSPFKDDPGDAAEVNFVKISLKDSDIDLLGCLSDSFLAKIEDEIIKRQGDLYD